VIKLWDGEPVVVECDQAAGFKLTPGRLERAISNRTRWVILNSPSNPTGAAYGVNELGALVEVLRRHPHVNVMSDEIYEHIVFDDFALGTISKLAPDLAGRTLIVNGVSKSYCMTGWRLGYAAGPEPMIGAMAKVQGQSTSAPCSISQYAAVEALLGNQDILARIRQRYQARRDKVVSELNRAPGISCAMPEGAFYVYPSCKEVLGKRTPDGRVIGAEEDFVLALLDCEGVAVVQGAAFGLSPHFRISIAASDEKLAEACTRIRRFCESLQG
jgi:aspartate aminotransferase